MCDILHAGSEQSRESIHEIAQKITPSQLRRIIAKMTNIETKERALQDTTTLTAFAQFKTKLLCDEVWFKHLKPKDIISLSANDEFYLHGLIALTKKHAKAQGCADPFLKFDFDILQRAGAEHITFQIAAFIAKSESLPLDDFKAFAKGDITLARCVLELMQSHPARFEMGEYFLSQHKELKDEIYKNWHQTKESVPLTSIQKSNLVKTVKSVSKAHPKFNVILETERVKRDKPDAKIEAKRNYNLMGMSGLGAFCMTAKLVPQYVALGGAALTSAKAAIAGNVICTASLTTLATPLVIPTSIALLMGGVTYLSRHGAEENKVKEAVENPPWVYKPLKIKWGS